MPNVQIEIATETGPKKVDAWAPTPRASLALHKHFHSDGTVDPDYTITHRATGTSLGGLLRNQILDRSSVTEMRRVLKTLIEVGAPMWAELDKLPFGDTRAPKPVIEAHRDTYHAMRDALTTISRRRLHL